MAMWYRTANGSNQEHTSFINGRPVTAFYAGGKTWWYVVGGYAACVEASFTAEALTKIEGEMMKLPPKKLGGGLIGVDKAEGKDWTVEQILRREV